MEHNSLILQWWHIIPFALLLGSIAVLPLWSRTTNWWENNNNKLALSLILGLPVALWLWLVHSETEAVVHSLLEYFQFIVLLSSLYIISGNVYLQGDIRATPKNNTIFLGIGGIIASFIGTTGAAMILIRPLLNINQQRTKTVHTVVFTIFIVANCGGLLTPLGDPPLFLGMLRGVPFTWTFSLWPYWVFMVGSLLIIYYLLDSFEYKKEPIRAIVKDKKETIPLRLLGKRNLLLLGGIILAVAFLPSVHLSADTETIHSWLDFIPWREIVMIFITVLSLQGPQKARQANRFDYHAIKEVAYLFIGIFLTMVPALLYLRQIAPHLPLNEITLFVFTGGLSSVLDNAPTYLTFFEMAQELGGLPAVAGLYEPYLISISLAAVFGGSITYIGNGPNFMVKAIAERRGVAMPSFLGYLRWSLIYILPLLVILVLFLL